MNIAFSECFYIPGISSLYGMDGRGYPNRILYLAWILNRATQLWLLPYSNFIFHFATRARLLGAATGSTKPLNSPLFIYTFAFLVGQRTYPFGARNWILYVMKYTLSYS